MTVSEIPIFQFPDDIKVKSPIYYRPGTLDIFVFKEIFANKNYHIPFDSLTNKYGVANQPFFEPKHVLDLGGNIGLASIFFATIYPDCEIITVEPDKENYVLLERNTIMYPQIHPINGAIWDSDEPELYIANRLDAHTRSGKQNPAAYCVVDYKVDGEYRIDAYTVPQIMKEYGWDNIDICKIDIQGAEERLFMDKPEWIPKVKLFIIETHDRIGHNCFFSVAEAMGHYGFRYFGTHDDGNILFFSTGEIK